MAAEKWVFRVKMDAYWMFCITLSRSVNYVLECVRQCHDLKFLLFEFSMRRKVGHQNLIQLFSIPSGANSFVCRVKFNSRQEKIKAREKFCSPTSRTTSFQYKLSMFI